MAFRTALWIAAILFVVCAGPALAQGATDNGGTHIYDNIHRVGAPARENPLPLLAGEARGGMWAAWLAFPVLTPPVFWMPWTFQEVNEDLFPTIGIYTSGIIRF